MLTAGSTTSLAGPIAIGAENLASGLADLAERALLDELLTWPKPGLVSHVDTGSHRDMDADTFRHSIVAIKPFFERLAAARGSDLSVLRRLGIDAEAAMLAATAGVNTHRGAIFALGLLCAAAGQSDRSAGIEGLVGHVRRRWGADILRDRPRSASHGSTAMARFGVGGARGEAGQGFPTAIGVGLPALHRGRLLAPGDFEAARVHCFFALLATLNDTNLLHRGGEPGLVFAKRAAAVFIAAGGVGRSGWRDDAESIHHAFVARRLSPGGSADLLAVTLFLDRYEAQAQPGAAVTE